ncbi:peptidase M24, structural domain-containing protein [Sphaerosporella brunnea]|uniref:Xaa-Pro aminopeptidase n=1 Tax=Sphaerosporella brunnea TaxID=1250544 RepID=A0A5J5ERB5_9PEZI|nr:peptidase M24, structural domain-containing protein [Sphaerosporella brunnea]
MAVLSGGSKQEISTLYHLTDALHISLSIPKLSNKYPAKQHARNVAARLPTHDGLIYLKGMPSQLFEDSDMAPKFRQRRYFQYLCGVTDIPDCLLTYRLESDELTLYIPPLNPAAVLWSGMPLGVAECLKKYDIDHCRTTAEFLDDLADYHHQCPASPIYILNSQQPSLFRNSNEKISVATVLPLANLDTDSLKPAMDACRVYKDDYEIAAIRQANKISADAHAAVLATVREGNVDNETQLEAVFLSTCISQFAKSQAYDPIIGSGRNAATLHYTRNNEPLKGRQLLLVDAGCEWEGYCADVTRTFPISGTFTKEAKEIYDLVEEMQKECIERCVYGMDFAALHLLAHRIAVRGLLRLGIFKGSEDEIFARGTSKAFFPHGLGHMLGLDVHDVELPIMGKSGLRTTELGVYDEIKVPLKGGARIMAPRLLEEGMVVTVEPGIYFCEWIITPYLKDPVHGQFIDKKVLDRYWDVGGVRIEDDILILGKGRGYENLTTAVRC